MSELMCITDIQSCKDNVDPVLDIQFLSEAYYKADDDYTGRTTVPALIDVKTGKVVNNDYHKLTNYFEVDFKPFHKKNAPDLYPEELRNEIDEMNYWLFDNINNGVYKTTFCRSKEAYWDAYNSFYAAMDLLEERLENQRFLFGDYVTDSDVRLYVTLVIYEFPSEVLFVLRMIYHIHADRFI